MDMYMNIIKINYTMDRHYYVYIYYYKEVAIYVGKGKGKRSHTHLKKCLRQKPGTLPFYDKLRFIINSGDLPTIKIIRDNLTNEESLLLEREIELSIGTVRENTGTLLNQVQCGLINPVMNGEKNPMYGISLYEYWLKIYGREMADEKMKDYCAKMSASLFGKKHTEETKNKMSHARKNWHDNLDEDTKKMRSDNISNSWTEERSKEHSKRISEMNKNRTGKNHFKSKPCIVEGKYYDCIKQIQDEYEFKNHNTVTNRLKSPNFPNWNYL